MYTTIESKYLSGEADENLLAGQRGVVIDDVLFSSYLIDTVEMLGGSIALFETFSEDATEYLHNEGVTFAIIHNYLINELETIRQIAQSGIKVLLIKRYLIPPEQVEEHEKICRELENEGVIIGSSMFRINDIRRFLLSLNQLPQTIADES